MPLAPPRANVALRTARRGRWAIGGCGYWRHFRPLLSQIRECL